MSDKPKAANAMPLQPGDICFVPAHDVTVIIKEAITDDLFVTSRSTKREKDRTMQRCELKFIGRPTSEGLALA